MKVGFIGCGNMGGALALAVAKSISPENVMIFDKDTAKAQAFAEKNGVERSDAGSIFSLCDYVFLGVKPQMLLALSDEIKGYLENSEVTLISMAAGVKVSRIEELFGDRPVIRIMPNLPVSVGEGMILYTANEKAEGGILNGFVDFMNNAGKLIRLDEGLFDAGTSVSGCGPAFVCMVLDAMAKGGERCGLDYDTALALSFRTLIGTSRLLESTKGDPCALRDAVCSPGGSTIEGVRSLMADGIEDSFIRAVCASYKRNIELGK